MWCEGEAIELSRELDVYDVTFLLWRGLGIYEACARVGVDIKSVRRWLSDPGKFLPPGAQVIPAWPEIFPLDSSQVPA